MADQRACLRRMDLAGKHVYVRKVRMWSPALKGGLAAHLGQAARGRASNLSNPDDRTKS
ncbi:MAG: hypothetical protein LBR95_02945 [Azoarcus sp.]|jgi:hypothetical protein|nr:hypothetical protein [Azoarcus sp.]